MRPPNYHLSHVLAGVGSRVAVMDFAPVLSVAGAGIDGLRSEGPVDLTPRIGAGAAAALANQEEQQQGPLSLFCYNRGIGRVTSRAPSSRMRTNAVWDFVLRR